MALAVVGKTRERGVGWLLQCLAEEKKKEEESCHPCHPLHFHALSTLVLVLSVVMALLSSFFSPLPPFFGGLETKASWLGGCLSDGGEGVSSICKEKKTTALELTLGNGKVTLGDCTVFKVDKKWCLK